ncbi:EAL domain-containing protein [Herbaspirillum sp. RV1423]|uniref:bifunctional diguanylate cyclase/phosphodiesterase n=1 Tax=Herbaspirillum sp. RV1423 TaxID=1443993 RepID=UPI0004AEA3F6|nr:EAL domain-containing protein [Herbaspirillum sp. RV1423]
MYKAIKRIGASISVSLTLIIGFGVTALLFLGTCKLEDDAFSLDFERRVMIRVTTLQRGLEEAVQVLTVINRLFATIDSPTRDQFHTFTEPLLEKYPHVQAFSFQRFVAGSERAGFERHMQATYPGFGISTMVDGKIVPAPPRERYLVVDYLEPMQGNRAALGLDLSGNDVVMRALQQAIESGKPVSTGALRLAQASTDERGLLVLVPVYRYGMPLNTVAQRRAAVVGDTTAVFHARVLLQRIFNAVGPLRSEDVEVSVYIGTSADTADLVYRSDNAGTGTLLPSWLGYRKPLHIRRTFNIAGQPWHLEAKSAPIALTANHANSLLILCAGTLLTLLAAAYLYTLSMRSRRIQRTVEERTAELRLTNVLLKEDIHARQQVERALQLRQRAIEASANAIIIMQATAPDYPIEYVNPAFERITGYGAGEVAGRSIRVLQSKDGDAQGFADIWNAMREQREGNVVLRSHNKNGGEMWNDFYIAPVKSDDGQVTHFVAALYDITSMKRYETELEFQANRDVLTGLVNRNMLRKLLEEAIAYAERYQRSLWVVFVDLDRFKFVNDSLGHKAGDVFLKTIAGRLRAAVRDTDTIARLGSDEFVIVISEYTGVGLDTRHLQRIQEAVAAPMTIEGHTFFPTCSLGVAAYPDDGRDAETLVKHADIAMYRAKQNGRDNYQFYTPAMNAQALERLRIEGDLRSALERNEFVLHYQPKIDLRSGAVVGMEALIRWQHPELGMVSPVRFISLAEETGLILPIGSWVIRTACAQTKAWQDAGWSKLRVSVNLSVRQFVQKDLVSSIAAVLKQTGLDADCLELELTESLVMNDVEHAIGILSELKELGVRLSIDDFGTGYSSLAYLKRFPIDVLKIDKSFVRDITVDADDAAITVSIISLAHSLKLHVIAEGVETQAQLSYLRLHGCDEMQGYLFSPPVPAERFGELLQEKSDTVTSTLAISSR